jgi:hypothetical protein
MIYSVTQPSGIDVQIQKYQTWLYGQLKTKWSISDNLSYDFYGRVARHKTESGYTPNHFVSSLNNPLNTQYKEVFFDQTNHAAVSFFYVDTKRNYKHGEVVANVGLFFIINAKKVKSTAWRASEEIRQDIYQLLHYGRFNFTFLGSDSTFKNVFRDFDGWINNDTLTYMDIEPMFILRCDLEVAYNIFDTN